MFHLLAAFVLALPPVKGSYWFSFGDSYTTTGFNINSTLPSAGNPLGNPAYPGFTGGGGANYVDYLTTQNNNSLILNYNFAVGGATIDNTIVNGNVLSVTDQVAEFKSSIASKPASTPWTSSNTLFSVWIGINDIGNSYSNGGGSTFNAKLITAYFGLVQQLYNSGARNFLFINVPPVDRSPLMLSQSASAQALEKQTILNYNSQLSAAVSKFSSANSGVKTWIWDSNAEFTTILNNPTAYGFKDATSYGATGDFWGNNYHPSQAAHQIFAQQIANLLKGTVW